MFHFLRPEWLWLLIPIAILGWKIWYRSLSQSAWQSIIDPRFKPILLGTASEQSSKPWATLGLVLIWIIATLALAGPSWKEVKLPAEKSTQGTVILMDLSLSMLSDDIKPNRLTRTRYKLIDLLKQHPEMAAGMAVYAGSAHTLVPISDDNETLISLIPTLSPMMMPSYGSDAVAGVKQAISLLKGAHIKQGHLIWVLDDIESAQIPEVVDLIKAAHISVSLLISGTADGGPISIPNYGLLKDDQGKIVIAKIPVARIQSLASKLDASVALMSNTDADLSELLPSFLSQLPSATTDNNQKHLSSWLDNGVYLLWLLVPLVALGYRRGWLFSWVLTSCLGLGLLTSGMSLIPFPTQAAENGEKPHQDASVHLLDVFKTPDQQGYEKWLEKDYQTAADRFESPQWKGASLYREGKYHEAQKQFSLDKTANGRFNEGNALAKLGKLDKAKTQYEQALKLHPHWDAAEKNMKLMDKLLNKPQNPPSSSNSKSDDNKQKNQNSGTDKNQNKSSNKNQQSSKNPPSSEGKNASKINSKHNNSSAQSSAKNDLNEPVQPPKSPKENPKDNSSEKSQDKSTDAQETKAQNAKDHQEKSLASEQADKTKAAESKPKDKSSTPQIPQDLAQSMSAGSNKPSKPLTEKEQAQRAWLNQIPDDPGLFLKRKFEYQYQLQHQTKTEEPKKIW